MKARYKLLGALAASLPVLAMAAATPAFAAQNPNARLELRDNIVPAAISGRTPTGVVASSKEISLTLGLAAHDQAGLAAFVAAVGDARSPLYKHYLTVHQFATRFGATASAITAVSSYLRSEGLKVGTVYANHLALGVTGTAAQVEKAFGVTLHTYRDAATKRDFYANAANPTLPASIASDVVSVAGLSTYGLRQHYSVARKVSPSVVAHATSDITPTKARGAYNLTSSISSGYNGSGETIGLVEFSAYEASDPAEYDSYYGLGATAASVVKVDGGTTDTSGDVEDELDIEVEYALAPKATVKVYEAPNSDAGEVALYAALVSNDVKVVSSSWGEAEDQESSADMSSDDTDFEEAASQGQSVYAASGDSGAYDDGSSLSVDFPASDTYVSGVGGTTLTLTSANAWKSETAWSDSGGGYSSDFSTPSYQTSVNSTGERAVPDVAADANPSSGWYIYTEGSWEEVGGTSAAAPNWAAFTADYDTAAADLGKSAFGYANSFIYSVAESSLYDSVFHDITSGNNGYYSAGTGYDEVTGWGSYNGGAFIADEL